MRKFFLFDICWKGKNRECKQSQRFQNQRMTEMERTVGQNVVHSTLLKQDHLEQIAWDYVKTTFEYLQGQKFLFLLIKSH